MEFIPSEDMDAFSCVGRVLWPSHEIAKRSLEETLSIVSLLQLSPEMALERATQALLERAKRESKSVQIGAHLELLNHPFYRLFLEERVILVALHIGHWSYARLSRILNLSIEQVEGMAWTARLKLAPIGKYPHAPYPVGEKCPAYHADRPWAQRYLDDEILTGRERIFLHGHLPECTACGNHLSDFRELYYEVGQETARLAMDPQWTKELRTLVRAQSRMKWMSEWGFFETLAFFVRRHADIQWILIGLGLIVAKGIWEWIRNG